MPFYIRIFSALPLTFARANPLMAEFDRIQAGFAAVESGAVAEVTAARQGQASLVLNLARYANYYAPAVASLDMGGHRVINAADGNADGDYVTVRQLNAAVFSPALPAQTSQAGKVIRTDGGSASWGDWWGDPVTLTAANDGATLNVRTTYHLDSSGGAFGLLMPAMTQGDWIKLVDIAGALPSNSVTLTRNVANGNLAGYAEDRILDVAWDSLELVKTSSGVIEQ